MALKGSIGDISVPDLLQIPLIGRLTGALSLTSHDREATVFYEKGAIVHAVSGETQGEQVVYDLLEWTEGTFNFDKSKTSPTVTVRKDVQHLLLEGLRRLDERARAEEARMQALRAKVGDPAALAEVLREALAGATMVVSAACLWDRTGQILAAWPKPIAAGTPEYEKMSTSLRLWKGAGRGWDQLYWATGGEWAAAWNLEGALLLSVLAHEKVGLGQLHFAFKKAAEATVQRLGVTPEQGSGGASRKE